MYVLAFSDLHLDKKHFKLIVHAPYLGFVISCVVTLLSQMLAISYFLCSL